MRRVAGAARPPPPHLVPALATPAPGRAVPWRTLAPPRVGAGELLRGGRREAERGRERARAAAVAATAAAPPPPAAAESAGSSRGLGGGGVWPQLLLLLLRLRLLHLLLARSICRGYGPSLEHKRVSAVEVCAGLAFPRRGVR